MKLLTQQKKKIINVMFVKVFLIESSSYQPKMVLYLA